MGILSQPHHEIDGTLRMERERPRGSVPVDVGRGELFSAVETVVHDFEAIDAACGIGHTALPEFLFQLRGDGGVFHPCGWTGFKVLGADDHGAFVLNWWHDANSKEIGPISSRVGGHPVDGYYTTGQGSHPASGAV